MANTLLEKLQGEVAESTTSKRPSKQINEEGEKVATAFRQTTPIWQCDVAILFITLKKTVNKFLKREKHLLTTRPRKPMANCDMNTDMSAEKASESAAGALLSQLRAC